MAGTPCGSVHESPVRGQRTRPTLEAVAPSLVISLRILARRMPARDNCTSLKAVTRTVVAVRFDVCHSDKEKAYRGFNVW